MTRGQKLVLGLGLYIAVEVAANVLAGPALAWWVLYERPRRRLTRQRARNHPPRP